MTCTEYPGATAPLSSRMILLFATLCAFAVANVYMTQPLLDQIALSLGERESRMGMIITATQTGYALGLMLLVPLGDLINRKRLVTLMLLASSGLLLAASMASSLYGLSGMLTLVGAMAVVVQIIVAFAASLSAPEKRGQVTGIVTSGVVTGILLARLVSGFLAQWAGWRVAIMVSAGAMFLMAMLFIRTAPDERKQNPSQSYRQLMLSVFSLWREIPALRSRGILALLIFMNFIHVTSQSMIFATRPQATSRLVAAYMFFYSAGSAIGALLATRVWSQFGWAGVCLLGATISALALVYWLLIDRIRHSQTAD